MAVLKFTAMARGAKLVAREYHSHGFEAPTGLSRGYTVRTLGSACPFTPRRLGEMHLADINTFGDAGEAYMHLELSHSW